MNCSECQELLVVYGEGLLDRQKEQGVARHLQSCRACRAEADVLSELRDRLVRDADALAGKPLDVQVMDRIFREQTHKLRRVAMIRKYRGRLSVGAAAAATIIAAVLAVTLLYRSVPTAYALEQTLEANRGVRTIHLKEDLAGLAELNPALAEKLAESGLDIPDRTIQETWAEFGDNGELLHLRIESPQTLDGPKVAIWERGKVEVWFKAKNSAVVLREPKIVEKYSQDFFDPKRTMRRLYEAAGQGEVKIETQEPSAEGEPIRLTATWPDPSERRAVYLVDPKTRLLQQVQTYKRDGDDYAFVSRRTFLEYNEPIDPAIFTLDLPANVVRIDQTTQEVGLAKGDLSDEEIAVEVVRQFFEAMIAEDYAKAGQLFEGIPAARMEETFGRAKWLRILSLAAATPQPIPLVGGLVVPYEIEIEFEGVKSVKKHRAAVRPVHNQPDRWTIHGGI